MFSALHDQLASLDRHVQLTRCFSAVDELLVIGNFTGRRTPTIRWRHFMPYGDTL